MIGKIEVRPLADKWFAEATPQNFDGNASATIGSGTNGSIELTHSDAETDDVVAIVVPGSNTAACSAAYAANKLTITLAVNSSSADLDANKAVTIAAAINALTGCPITAEAGGTGAGKITAATTSDVAFTAGHDGTPCPEKGTALYDADNDLYYVCAEANNTAKNANWKKFSIVNL